MTQSSTTTAPGRFLLLGDSHTRVIGRAASAAGIPFHGGPLGAGREFTAAFFEPRATDVVFTKPEAQEYYRGFLAEFGVDTLAEVTVPIVATFGFSAHFVATRENWLIHRRDDGSFPPGFLGGELFGAIVCAMVRDALAFYRHALGLGLRVLAVLPPQRVPGQSDPDVFLAAQDRVADAAAALGVEIVDLRPRLTDASGFQRPEFCEPDDEIHGNLASGRLILRELLERGL